MTDTHDYYQRSLDLHRFLRGKLGVFGKAPVLSREHLSLLYTPGVARASQAIADDPAEAWQLTIKRNTVAVVSDGSAVLGLGNIGAAAAMPVMEGKALLFKSYANIDAWPIVLDTQEPQEIINTVRHIAPGFGGVNLEDISAPRCFEVESALQDLGIPVFHDDQHGTAIVLLAALVNATRVLGKQLSELRVVISGAGAAGTAIARLLECHDPEATHCIPVADVIVCDRHGAIHEGRDDLPPYKADLASWTNRDNRRGTVHDVIEGADVFIGVSTSGLLDTDDVKRMAKDSIILAMANPEPEIRPDQAYAGGAAIVGTGRSDYPNQVNNVLAFPGVFRGALDAHATRITTGMKMAAVFALADAVQVPSRDQILPDAFDAVVAPLVARAVAAATTPEVRARG